MFSGFAGYQLSDLNKPSATPKMLEIRSQENYKFTNPLLECEMADFYQNKNISRLKPKLQNLVDNKINNYQISHASIYYRDLNNGPWIGINEKEDFSPSSLIKVPIMISYFKLAETDPNILKQELQSSKIDDLKYQNIKPEITLVPNQNYTIEELIRRMIVYSDNIAYEMLIEYLSAEEQIKIYKDLGVDISKAYNDPYGNIIPVKAYATFFRILYNSSYLNKNMSEKALELLSQSTFNQGLIAGLPPNTLVSHKFGEREYLDTGIKQLHDCGIIYTQKPYLLCIMTRGNNFDNLTSTIKEISSLVYTTLQSQN